MTRYAVTKIPVRTHNRGRQSVLGLQRLEVGESILIPAEELVPRSGEPATAPLRRLRARVISYQRQWKRGDGSFERKFAVGVQDYRGVRIGRIL